MKFFSRSLAVISLITVLPFSSLAFADSSSLEQRLDDLEQQVAILKRQIENSKEDAKTQASTTAVVTANSKDGFSIKSPNGDYSLRIGGYTQIEAREFAASNKEELDQDSSILARRVRLIISGTVAHDFDFFLQPDFGYNDAFSTITSTTPSAYSPSLQDAWIDYKYFPDFTIKAGKFKTPFDLENLQDTRYTDFIELGLTSNLVPQRDIGVQVGGNLYYDWITYAGGIFDGAADRETEYGGYSTTANGDTNSKSGVGRIFVTPFKDMDNELLKGLGVGYAGSYGNQKGSDLPSFITPGQAPIFTYNSNVTADGLQVRTEPQAYYYYKSVGVLGEYVTDREALEYTSGGHINRITPTNKAWSVEGNYVLTGEDASYNGVTPRHDFDPSKGNWGAWELVSRYGELYLDNSIFNQGFASPNTSVSSEKAWATGINWYLNHNVKLAFAFEQTNFDRGAVISSNGGSRKPENLYTGLVQLSF